MKAAVDQVCRGIDELPEELARPGELHDIVVRPFSRSFQHRRSTGHHFVGVERALEAEDWRLLADNLQRLA
jgi:hypothetical protein